MLGMSCLCLLSDWGTDSHAGFESCTIGPSCQPCVRCPVVYVNVFLCVLCMKYAIHPCLAQLAGQARLFFLSVFLFLKVKHLQE